MSTLETIRVGVQDFTLRKAISELEEEAKKLRAQAEGHRALRDTSVSTDASLAAYCNDLANDYDLRAVGVQDAIAVLMRMTN